MFNSLVKLPGSLGLHQGWQENTDQQPLAEERLEGVCLQEYLMYANPTLGELGKNLLKERGGESGSAESRREFQLTSFK